MPTNIQDYLANLPPKEEFLEQHPDPVLVICPKSDQTFPDVFGHFRNGTAYTVKHGDVLGRSDNADIKLPCMSVSRAHAVFEKQAEQGSKLSNLEMKIHLSEGKIFLDSKEYSFPPWDEQAMLIFKAGGLVEYTKQRLQNK